MLWLVKWCREWTEGPENWTLGNTTFIHSGYFYSTSSSPLPLRGTPYYSIRVNTSRRYRQLWVKPKVPAWRLELESNLRPSGRKALNLPLSHHGPEIHWNQWGGCSPSAFWKITTWNIKNYEKTRRLEQKVGRRDAHMSRYLLQMHRPATMIGSQRFLQEKHIFQKMLVKELMVINFHSS